MIAYDLKDIHAAKSLAKYCEKFDLKLTQFMEDML